MSRGPSGCGGGLEPYTLRLIGRRLILPKPQSLTLLGSGFRFSSLTFRIRISWQQRTCLHARERIFAGGETDLAASGDDFCF